MQLNLDCKSKRQFQSLLFDKGSKLRMFNLKLLMSSLEGSFIVVQWVDVETA